MTRNRRSYADEFWTIYYVFPNRSGTARRNRQTNTPRCTADAFACGCGHGAVVTGRVPKPLCSCSDSSHRMWAEFGEHRKRLPSIIRVRAAPGRVFCLSSIIIASFFRPPPRQLKGLLTRAAWLGAANRQPLVQAAVQRHMNVALGCFSKIGADYPRRMFRVKLLERFDACSHNGSSRIRSGNSGVIGNRMDVGKASVSTPKPSVASALIIR